MQFSMCEVFDDSEDVLSRSSLNTVVVSESSHPLNTCYTLKRVDYICTGDMSTDHPAVGDMTQLK